MDLGDKKEPEKETQKNVYWGLEKNQESECTGSQAKKLLQREELTTVSKAANNSNKLIIEN